TSQPRPTLFPYTTLFRSNGPGGIASDSVTVTVFTIPPTADIKADGSDVNVTIPFGGSAIISWTSTNATFCSVSNLSTGFGTAGRSEEHTSELQSQSTLVC